MRDRFMICFGAQRGGTTWLHQQLWNHPAFDLPPRKEIRYLDPIYVHDFAMIQRQRINEFRGRLAALGSPPRPVDLASAKELAWAARYTLVSAETYTDQWYRSLFDGCDPDKVTGDMSPDYSLLPEAGVAHLARLCPSAKLVFMARDPVDRAISGAKYVLRHNPDLSDADAARRITEIATADMQLKFSRYDEILARFRRHFDPSRILVAFHDDIATDPHRVLRQVCNHVGVAFDPADFPTADGDVNRSPDRPTPEGLDTAVAEKLRPTLDWLADKFGGPAALWPDRYITHSDSRLASAS